MSTVFIVGASGFIGTALVEGLDFSLHKVVSVGRDVGADFRLDLASPESFDYSGIKKGDFIVLTSAISSPDICRDQRDYAYSINVVGTKVFIENVIANGANVIFLSSDAVYESNPMTVYNENSSLNPMFDYGKMKAEVEAFFKKESAFKALRLSYVYSRNDKYTKYLISCFRNNEIAEIFHPYYRNSVSITEVIETIEWLVLHWDNYPYPALNLAGEELVSRLEMADEFKNYVGGRFEYRITVPDEKFYEARPKVTRTRSNYLYEWSIVPRDCFSNKYWRELKGIINND